MEDEYYTSVYSWFDKRGIISNIRTHLRQNLVNALRNKNTDKKFETKTPKSAKQYVYDLLVAEYLWNHNYVYTLSIFASETPLLVDLNKQIETDDKKNKLNAPQKLQSDYVNHTLETLGIEPSKAKGQSIIKDYTEKDLPLLLCILQYTKLVEDNFNELDLKELKINNTTNKEVQTEENEVTVNSEKVKIANAKKKLVQQKHLFDSQLKQKEKELKEQTVIIEEQLHMLQNKLQQAQKLMHTYLLKEKQLHRNKIKENLRISQRENELIIREKLLDQEANRLEQERDSYIHFEENLKKLQDELSKVKNDLPTEHKNHNFNVNHAEVQTDFESYIIANNERNILHQEKKDLNGLVKEQQSRIEQLTSKVVYLSRKLEEMQLKHSCAFQEMPSTIIKVVNTNTIASENSSTEDILQDAKMRLRRLEEESLKAEQYYSNFISNLS